MKKIKYSQNKKGIAFAALMPLIFIVFFLFLTLAFVSPVKDIKGKIEFGDNLKRADLAMYSNPSYNFFIEEEINSVVQKGKEKYVQSLTVLGGKSLDTVDKNILLDCEIESIDLWYNQVNVDNNNFYSGTKNVGTCLPEFKDVDKNYLNYLETELKDNLNSDVMPYSQVGVTKSQDGKNHIVDVNTKYALVGEVGKVVYDYPIKKEYVGDGFALLLENINQNLEGIGLVLKKEVASCVNNGQGKSELDCISESFDNQFLSTKELKDIYEFKVDYIDKVSQVNQAYIGLNVKIYNKKTNSQELNFGVIIEDSIPFTPLTFSVESSKDYPNTADLWIDKPKYADNVFKYFVIYSYENFLDSSKYTKYNDLMKAFRNNEVPNKLTNLNAADHNKNQYYYSDEFGITLMMTGDGSFVETNGRNEKKLSIYQIYNPDSREFELISRPVYAYVFAMDHQQNFFPELEGLAQKITTQDYGPEPILSGVKITSPDQYQNSLWVKIENYQDSEFNNFDLYVAESSSKFAFKSDTLNKFYHFDGVGVLDLNSAKKNPDGTVTNNYDFMITSDQLVIADNQANGINTISTDNFNLPFTLENDKEYDIYIIPKDAQGVGLYDSRIANQYIQDSSMTEVFFKQDQTKQTTIKPFSEKVKVLDQKPADISDIKFENPNINIKEGKYYLQWKSISGSVTKLFGNLIYEDPIVGSTSVPIEIAKDGEIPISEELKFSLEITELYDNGKLVPLNSVVQITYP